ncbi:hypothetical protein [uncultured Polaribacter sp.]|uniref:hypothetical protein n=1 Tax=uncultured Polaribacter sp. TaxID=174711 RepID=UPI00260DB3F2|nr:hypothetical protein [uncultured Polaribacter sp.]
MEAKIKYKSFNTDKTIEELKYNLINQREVLRNLIIEHEFYKKLLNAPIYKSQKRNLFEILEGFKVELKKTVANNQILLNEIGMQLFQIDKKVECDDLLCDNFFIKEIDDLEFRIHHFHLENSALKSRMFEYLQHVIIDQ